MRRKTLVCAQLAYKASSGQRWRIPELYKAVLATSHHHEYNCKEYLFNRSKKLRTCFRWSGLGPQDSGSCSICVLMDVLFERLRLSLELSGPHGQQKVVQINLD